MAFQRWQIGLDIQNRHLCALGIERRRHGWQLRHWWQQALPHDTLRNGVLQSSPLLQQMLASWRRQLPAQFSLRVGLPPQLVLQRTLPLPDTSLREPALNRYVTAAARTLFPMETALLAFDYQCDAAENTLQVTAARRDVMAQWLQPLQQAGLEPDIFELSTQALMQVAQQLPLALHTLLIHPAGEHGFWVFNDGALRCGSVTGALNADTVTQLFPQVSDSLCTSSSALAILQAKLCLPLSLLRYQQPPLPAQQGDFTLALGLALRPGDSSC